MIKQFSTASGWPRFSLSASVLCLLFMVVLASVGRADDPPQRLTAEQRTELEGQAYESYNAGVELCGRGSSVPPSRRSERLSRPASGFTRRASFRGDTPTAPAT